jgi:dTDP-4-dehydrorhamnose reductase
VLGTVRDGRVRDLLPPPLADRLIDGIDVLHEDVLPSALGRIRPDVVINCAGLTKHQPETDEVLVSIPINTLMPHRLAKYCSLLGARLIHVSTDCVFSGEKGGYVESDVPDATDVYGRSKALGEVVYANTVTLRTSTIGHELQGTHGLLGWFLSQEASCKGYTRAVFSGLPTVIFARVVRDVVIPDPELSGLIHVAAKPIAKYDLLGLLADVYGKSIDIVPDDGVVIDRSLDAGRFHDATGYVAPEWEEMIRMMHAYE